MLLRNLTDLAAGLAPGQRLLGLDVGTKTIGLAISDGSLTIATPLTTIRRERFSRDAAKLGDIVAAREVGGLVIGLPINMNGTEGSQAQAVRQFAANVDGALGLPMGFWDERLSTSAVTRDLLTADMSRKRRREVVDKMAAAYILQGALDSLRFRPFLAP
jgi:putative Holliday junction resolvase